MRPNLGYASIGDQPIRRGRRRTSNFNGQVLLLFGILVLGYGIPFRSARSADTESTNDLSELESPVIDQGFEKFLRQHPEICRGGTRAESTKKLWLAVAVGRVGLKTEDGREISLSDGTKIARTKAHRDLATMVHGFKLSAEDKGTTSSRTGIGKSEIIDRFRSVTKQEVDAMLQGAEIVGTWRLDKGESVVVMVAIGDPKHPLFEHPKASPPAVKLRNENWEGNWREAFVDRPAILGGGASFYRHGETIVILAVGKALLKGDPVVDRRKELVASTNAAKEALQLVKGLKISGQSTAIQESRRVTADEVTTVNEARETLEKTSSEKLLAAIRVTKAVASWESMDGQYYFIALAFKLSELK